MTLSISCYTIPPLFGMRWNPLLTSSPCLIITQEVVWLRRFGLFMSALASIQIRVAAGMAALILDLTRLTALSIAPQS
jgi:hypothetical protein